MKKPRKKDKDSKNPFAHLGVGFFHYLRSGSGVHKDRKKESTKYACRRKYTEE